MEAGDVKALRETLDRLRLEVAELRASRERLVLAADDERRSIERELHHGVQQQLVALAVNLQLTGPVVDDDPAAAKELLAEMERDVQRALDETAQLAELIYPPLLEARGLATALRSASGRIGSTVFVEVAADASYAPEIVRTVYLGCLEALERAGEGARATVTVRETEGALVFEVVEDGAGSAAAGVRSGAALERLRDRVEALGGRLTLWSDSGRSTRVSGWLPLSR